MINDYTKLGVPQYYYFTMDNCEFLSRKEYDIISIRLDGSGLSIDDYYTAIEGTDYYVMTSTGAESFGDILDYLNAITYINVRSYKDDGIFTKGIVSNNVKNAVSEVYELGLIDARNGVIDLSRELSCGESLYYSYKVVCSFINANR